MSNTRNTAGKENCFLTQKNPKKIDSEAEKQENQNEK